MPRGKRLRQTGHSEPLPNLIAGFSLLVQVGSVLELRIKTELVQLQRGHLRQNRVLEYLGKLVPDDVEVLL